MQRYTTVLENERVKVDGRLFKDTHFKNCTFLFSAERPPAFENCWFDGVLFEFQGPAANFVNFFRVAYQVPGFAPQIERIFDVMRGKADN